MSTADENLKALGLGLPEAPVPVATYVPYRQEGRIFYISGQGPKKPDGTYHRGTVGQDVTIGQAYEHARLTGLYLLSVRPDRSTGSACSKLFGMIKAAPANGMTVEIECIVALKD